MLTKQNTTQQYRKIVIVFCWMIKEVHKTVCKVCMCIHTHRNIFFFYVTGKKIEEYAMPRELTAVKMVWIYIFLNWSISQYSHSVASNSLRPHGLQHTRLPCPLPTPGVCLNSCPSCRWCHHHLILCHPRLLLSSIFPSIRVLHRELVLHIRRPKFWSFSFSISPSNEYLGLISFRID